MILMRDQFDFCFFILNSSVSKSIGIAALPIYTHVLSLIYIYSRVKLDINTHVLSFIYILTC